MLHGSDLQICETHSGLKMKKIAINNVSSSCCTITSKAKNQRFENFFLHIARSFATLLTLWNSEQKNGLLIKLFCFTSDFDETGWNCSTYWVLQLHQVSSKSDEKQKSFINSPFFCSEFQSVSRIMKIVHSA